MSKTCFKCLQSKPLTEFYEHRGMGDGHLGKCKECAKADVRMRRDSKLDEIRKHDRDRHVGQRRANSLAAANKWAAEHKSECAAQRAVHYAVRTGRLTKPSSCSRCCAVLPRRMIHGHHEDYSKPLEVVWLCISCHRQHHAAEARKAG